MGRITLLLWALFLALKQCTAFSSDEIKHLPGLNVTVPFKQYSGYLDATKGRHLFYWLVESEHNSSSAPLVLWLNGGPGCSSLEGFLTENGPFRVTADGTNLEQDPFSWNKLANVLYIESPINVGFSYNSSHLADEDLYNDEATTDANYHALLSFFTKFPSLKMNQLFITGESYGGVYIPLLTRRILANKQQTAINLQGMAIGNGVYDMDILAASRLEYAYFHGLVGIDQWEQLQSVCCHLNGKVGKFECDFPVIYSNYSLEVRHGNQNCSDLVGLALFQMKATKVNLYYIYDTCNSAERNGHPADHQCVSDKWEQYLNQEKVKEALHVAEAVRPRSWESCNQYILMHYSQQYTSMESVFRDIMEKHQMSNVLIYSGDADIVCDFLSSQRFLLHRMKYKLKEASRPWMLSGSIAGVATRFQNGLRFYTVHGAGHMVPTQRPRESLAILKDLLAIEKIA